ncbi:Myb-like_DNA-binding domain-containing protein [Hexamita inflata]|uniref:Myb-like DNA-binding domain-containing protein n=1 Tax=Hexamita inflata TaxID=28002 RepID=A0AA86Q688_9EUKA|nr:Myb-like DNA-binding domain-containing protein [Hexamita inflata]
MEYNCLSPQLLTNQERMDYDTLSPSTIAQLSSLSSIFKNYVAEQEYSSIILTELEPQSTPKQYMEQESLDLTQQCLALKDNNPENNMYTNEWTKDKWTDFENKLLLSAVQNLKFNTPAQIASVVKTKSTKQVISHQQKLQLDRIYENTFGITKTGICEEEIIGTALEYIRNVLKINCNNICLNMNIQEHFVLKEGVLQLNKQLVRQMVRLPHKMVSAYKAIIAEIQKPIIALQFVAKKQNVNTGVAAMVIFVSK